MFVATLLVVAIATIAAAMLLWGKGRQIGVITHGFGTSPRAVELLHASVAAVPANSFDARLRIIRR